VTTPSTTVVWDPRFLDYDFGGDHPFAESSRGLAVSLVESTLAADEQTTFEWVRSVEPSSRAELERFHEPPFLDFVERAGTVDEPMYLDAGDTPSFPGCFIASARIAAGALAALRRTTATGRPAVHPGGGLHHAAPDHASGFCIFNDVALAIAEALETGRKVAYIDIDAHHGDGVMYGFYESGKVLDIDFHQDGRTLFPGTGYATECGRGDGHGLKVNVPLIPTAGDEAILPIFRRIVPPLIEEFRPDVIVLQHGVDGHYGDPLTRLQYTPVAYAEVDRLVLELANRCAGGHVLVAGGGGYRPESVSRVLARATRIFGRLPVPDDERPVPEEWRLKFFDATEAEAPKSWAEIPAVVPTRWRPELEAGLISELESVLGRKFPKP